MLKFWCFLLARALRELRVASQACHACQGRRAERKAHKKNLRGGVETHETTAEDCHVLVVCCGHPSFIDRFACEKRLSQSTFWRPVCLQNEGSRNVGCVLAPWKTPEEVITFKEDMCCLAVAPLQSVYNLFAKAQVLSLWLSQYEEPLQLHPSSPRKQLALSCLQGPF